MIRLNVERFSGIIGTLLLGAVLMTATADDKKPAPKPDAKYVLTLKYEERDKKTGEIVRSVDVKAAPVGKVTETVRKYNIYVKSLRDVPPEIGAHFTDEA